MLVAEILKEKLIKDLQDIDNPEKALNQFWKSVCEYFGDNAEVYYTWTGTNPAGVTDPIILMKGSIQTMIEEKTLGSLEPSEINEVSQAFIDFNTRINTAILSWKLIPQEGFILTIPEIPNIIPSVLLTPSYTNDRDSALLHLSEEIIKGVISAIPSIPGIHGAFVGVANFSKII